jgi:hypothetical protein
MPTFNTPVNFNNTNRGTNGGHRVGDLLADAAGDLSALALGGANGDGTAFDIPPLTAATTPAHRPASTAPTAHTLTPV